GRGVAAIERELAQELARQHLFPPGTCRRRERQGLLEVFLGSLELAAAAAQHPDREQCHRLAHRMADLARDLERLAEVLLGEVPLPEAIADEPEVLVVPAHARIETGALVEP